MSLCKKDVGENKKATANCAIIYLKAFNYVKRHARGGGGEQKKFKSMSNVLGNVIKILLNIFTAFYSNDGIFVLLKK